MDIPLRVVDRVLNKMTPDEGDCHVSWYSVGSHGYAQVGWSDGNRTIMMLCHRVVWIAARGPIPEGYEVDHLCLNRRCVNVEHMRLLDQFENSRRTSGRDWPLGQCIKGHPNSELVTYGGKRKCRICNREWQRRWYAKNPEKEAEYNRRYREKRKKASLTIP